MPAASTRTAASADPGPDSHAGADPDSVSGLGDLAALLGGRLLGAAFGVAARLRGTRALHAVGYCGSGSLTVSPSDRSGVVLLDEPGPHPCLVRWSRATGMRDGPDVEGLAVRLQGPAAGDILVASTGTGVLTRHLLTVRARRDHGPLTTLLPLSTPNGPLLLRFDPLTSGDDPPAAYRLLVSAPGRPWHERGRLDVTWTDDDCTRRHDPVGHPPAGTWTHPVWARLRKPSYAASEGVRADPEEPRHA